MALADDLVTLATAKSDIVTAVQGKGGTLATDPPITNVAAAILGLVTLPHDLEVVYNTRSSLAAFKNRPQMGVALVSSATASVATAADMFAGSPNLRLLIFLKGIETFYETGFMNGVPLSARVVCSDNRDIAKITAARPEFPPGNISVMTVVE